MRRFPEPETGEEIVEKETVSGVIVTPKTPPGRELAQRAHNGEWYTVVEFYDKLAAVTASRSPFAYATLAGEVLRSYGCRQTRENLDLQ